MAVRVDREKMGKGKAYHQGGDDDLQAETITGDDVRRSGGGCVEVLKVICV